MAYTDTDYLFQTIEMGKSDEEYEIEFCSTPPPTTADFVDEPSIFNWKVVKRRQRPYRRHTVSHGAPPAPPSTPTSLTATGTLTPSPTSSSATTTAANNSAVAADDERLNSLLYILDYAPKYKKKLKEQQRTDAELAELLNVVTITGGSTSNSSYSSNNDANKSAKLPPERGISAASRTIRKHDASTKIFKIHRNPKEFFREPDDSSQQQQQTCDGEEDFVSAPEYDTEDVEECYRRRRTSRQPQQIKRHRRRARFEHQERMDAMVNTFDAAMNFKDDNA